MPLFFSRKASRKKQPVLETSISTVHKKHSLETIIALVKAIRPSRSSKIKEAEANLRRVMDELRVNPSLLEEVKKSIALKFQSCNVEHALTDSGLMSSRAFVQELWHRLKWKFLPKLYQKEDLLYLTGQIFSRKSDYKWVQSIHSDLWNELFDLLEIKITVRSKRLQHGMTASLRLLSYRLSAAGLASEILEHLKDKEQESAPFVRQNILVNHLFDDFVQQSHKEEHPWNVATIQEIIKSLHDCKKQIEYIRQHRNEVGTSVEQTFLLIKMSQISNRMLLILDWMQHPDAFQQTNFLGYFTGLVKNQNLQNSIREFISQNYSLLAYQIAEHKGKKGLHYIAYAKKAYWILFKKSMQGGVVAGFMSMVKVMIANLGLPAFSQSILYSLNYATGFVFIDQTGSTLATKQPSYTASSVARSLDLKATEGHPNLKNLALTVAAVFRSQMASFAGNILLVFPVALLLAATCSDLFGYRLVDNEHALHLLEANHPFRSAALLYACVAGCFLFFSGLVAGYVENRILFARVPERMLHLPALRQLLSKKRLHSWSDFVKRKMGAFVGSVSLAFMLGFASYFGKITGLPFDIRHVTLATGNVAIALYEVYDQVTALDLLEIVFGLALIGMLNLLVSFTLAFMVAIRSRKINLKDYQEFAGILYRYFKRYPGDFFRSPSKLRSTDELS